MRIVANRQLAGEYGVLGPNQDGVVQDHIGQELIDAGYARPYSENKADAPAEAPAVAVAAEQAGPSENKADTPTRRRG